MHLPVTIAQVPTPVWVSLLVLLALAVGHRAAAKTRTTRPRKSRRTITGFAGMSAVVTLGFGLSANTSIRFAESRLHMVAPWTLTIGLALEGIVLGLTLYSWAFGDKGAARVAYMLVFAQAVGAVEVVRFEGEDAGTALVRIVGPVMLAYGLHKLLGLETRLGKIQIASDGILARLWADQKNRLESRLGIGARGADVAAISRSNAADKFVHLNSVGKPWHMTTRMYRRALVKSGRAALHGLDGYGRQMAEANLVDRIAYEKGMQEGGAHIKVAFMQGVRSNTGTPLTDAALPNVDGPLTSAAPEATPPGHAPTTPEPQPAKPQPRSNPATTDAERRTRAFRVYADLAQPSQRAFTRLWRERGYGESDQTVRALYAEMHAVFQQAQNGNSE
ncbi:hypothetical protein [Streptomyces sp. NPDC056188]|uniref:hypothetical protein n=1 Tax=Streptomyces sp. NPDC056188 TaxID=3345740 RepID=UPI0035DC9C80